MGHGMRDGVYQWLVVAMLWFVCLFNYADRQAIASVLDPIGREMVLNDVQLGIISGAFMWIYAAALPFAGLLGDRFSRKRLILGGLMFWSVITLLTAWSSTYAQLVICRALEGLGESLYFPASMSLLSAYHGPRTRSRAMALHQSSVYAGTILGGGLAGFLAMRFGWRSGFVLFGSLGLVLGLVLIFVLKEPERDEPVVRGEPRPRAFNVIGSLLRSPAYLALVAVFAGANFVAAIGLSWMPTYLGRTFKMNLAMAGLNGTAWAQIGSVVGVLAGGWMADRAVLRRAGGRMRIQAIGLLVGVPFLYLTGSTRSVPILILALIGFGLGKGLYDSNIWASLYDVVPSRDRATALGLMNATAWLSGGAGTVLFGWAAPRFGIAFSLAATSGIYLVFGVVMVLVAWAKDAAGKGTKGVLPEL